MRAKNAIRGNKTRVHSSRCHDHVSVYRIHRTPADESTKMMDGIPYSKSRFSHEVSGDLPELEFHLPLLQLCLLESLPHPTNLAASHEPEAMNGPAFSHALCGRSVW